MTNQPRARYKVGDRVQVQSGTGEVGRVAAILAPDACQGHITYRIEFPSLPGAQSVDIAEYGIRKTCLPESGTPAPPDPVHPEPTQRSQYCYEFSGKHHGGGKKDDARWLPELSRVDEFSVFDTADYHDICNDRGWLYGALRADDGTLAELGTWQEQIAEFPLAKNRLWHGYPQWIVNTLGPPDRRGEDVRPSKGVFDKMERARVITKRERKRLYKGDHV